MRITVVFVFGALMGAVGFVAGAVTAVGLHWGAAQPHTAKASAKETLQPVKNEVVADKKTKGDHQRIAAHPWWNAPLTKEKSDALVAAIFALPNNEFLAISKKGTWSAYRDSKFSSRTAHPETVQQFGCLADGEYHSAPIVFSVRDGLGRQKARVDEVIHLLRDLLDWAQESDEEFRRTGKGATLLDMLLNQQK